MKILAPAKINLYLKILGKRPDGYHELETLMCPTSLADEIELEECSKGIHIAIEGAELAAGPENLVHRAAQAVQRRAKIQKGVKIFLRKNIPLGAGLGGGSSDAAVVLLAVNKLWQAGLDETTLNQLAAELGSDVNFFLQPHPAVCTGRGEKIQPVDLHYLPFVVLIYPGFEVSSLWAYKTYAQNPQPGASGKTFHWNKAGEGISLQNDLEPAVFSKHLWIAETKKWLQNHPLVDDALMSGSGATVFAILSNEKRARQLVIEAKKRLGNETWICFTRLLNNSLAIQPHDS